MGKFVYLGSLPSCLSISKRKFDFEQDSLTQIGLENAYVTEKTPLHPVWVSFQMTISW